MPVTEIATAFGKAAAPAAVSLLRSFGRRKYDEIIANYTTALNKFMDSSAYRCRTVKTLLNIDDPVPLSDIYVQTRLENDNGEIVDQDLIKRLSNEPGAFAITGFAGSGKSMFMKYAASTLIDSMLNHQRIPLFIEVRDLDFKRDSFIFEKMIFEYCTSSENRSTFDQFCIGLREGIFVIILDGVDEAPVELLDKFIGAIDKFHRNNRQCAIIASVRPGTRLPTASHFRVYRVKSMSLDQVIEVVSKAPYSVERKDILLESLKSGLYITHKDFLSNPLLVTIVLITFDDASMVPEHLTGFYAAAFDALFGKHDWSKGVFVRQHKAGLEKSAFEKVFTYFCYMSYFHSSYIFDKDQVIKLIDSAIKQARLETEPSLFLEDCIVSVCLLQIDEPKIIFVHRSFQEYFTAKFVSQYSGPKFAAMIDWLSKRAMIDNAFLMTVQLNREAVCRLWGLPKSMSLLQRWKNFLDDGKPEAVLQESGIETLLGNLRTGKIEGFAANWERGYGALAGLMTLLHDRPSRVETPGLDGGLYKFGSFSSIPERTKRVLRSATQGDVFRLNLAELSNHRDGELATHELATQMIDHLEQAHASIEAFLSEQDEIASQMELVDPFEIGLEA